MRQLIVILLMINFDVSFAQSDTLLQAKVNELKALFQKTAYDQLQFKDTSLQIVRDAAAVKEQTNYPNRATYLNARAEQLKKDIGLDIAGSFIENFNLDPVQDIEENISYSRRVQVGMQWDILQGGLLENRARANMMNDQAERVNMLNNYDQESRYYLARFDQIIFIFNQFKIQLLKQRERLLKDAQRIIRELVYFKKLQKEELIEIDILVSEVQGLIHIYQSYNNYLALSIPTDKYQLDAFPVIDLNYPLIFDRIGIQSDSLMSQSDYVNYLKWYHQIGLRPFMRYNYYDMTSSNDRSYFSAGINFTVPINFDTDLNNQVEQARWSYENDRLIHERTKVKEDVMSNAHDFRTELRRFMDRYQRRKLVEERLRVEKAKVRLSQAKLDPIVGLKLIDDLLKMDIDLIESTQALYLKALKIQSKIPGTTITELVKVKPMNEHYSSAMDRKRSVYVWSSTFEDFNGAFLTEYAVYNEFEKMIVAVSDAENYKEKNLFMQYAGEVGDIYLMLGNNKLFYHENIKEYLGDVLENNNTIQPKGIHLDIEPHTFEDWPANKSELLRGYLALVTAASEFCNSNDLKLEISVPKHYDEEIMNQLFDIVDKVYFMCYENVDTDFLVRKLRPYTDKYLDKVVIALRTEDFKSRLDFEDKIDALQTELEVKEFAYHDLKRLILFDKKGSE